VEDRFAAFDERNKETERRIENNFASNATSNEVLARLEARLRQAEANNASSSASEEILTRHEARLKQAQHCSGSLPQDRGKVGNTPELCRKRTQEVLERHFASIGLILKISAPSWEIEGREDSTPESRTRCTVWAPASTPRKKNREALADLEANLGEATSGSRMSKAPSH
jgi:hypothetical protein